ncbi:MAG TPA: flavodoxin [Kofleriaceae bacterium]|nr:flavodoxin [Kofleriaceae bacterium]
MSRILVVYYTRSGTARTVAGRLAGLLGADLEEIVDPTPRAGWRGFVRSAVEARRAQLAPIAPSQHDPADYDLVVIGTPIWFASVSSPVRAYLRRHRGAIRAAAFFCTYGGSGSGRVLEQMKAEAKLEPVARMALREDDLPTVLASLSIERFASEVRAAPPTLQVVPAVAVAAATPPPTPSSPSSDEGSRRAPDLMKH